LPGTVKELGNLQKWFGTERMQRLEGSQVTPERLLQTIPSADIIHLATHAYVTDFAKNAVTNNKLNTGAVRITADQRSPLLAARMALSLANDFEKDAILTGEQFAATDLSKTKLVVLSACESGVGEKVLGEGVFGLQRAFHIAGVPSVLATLWPVSDADAVIFMDFFYTELIERQQTPAAALRAAQLAMIAADERVHGAVRSVEDGEPVASAVASASLRRGIRFDFAPDDATPVPALGTEQTDDPTRSQTKSSTSRSTWAAFFLSTD
jgi:CHAT domain-containing protein